MHQRVPARWVIAALLTSASIGCSSAASSDTDGSGQLAEANCAAPELGTVQFSRPHHEQPALSVRPGGTLTVYGRYFLADCYDSGNLHRRPPLMHSVTLRLTTADGRTARLAAVHPAGELGTFRARVRVPDSAAPGRARITARRALSSRVVVTRS